MGRIGKWAEWGGEAENSVLLFKYFTRIYTFKTKQLLEIVS